MEKTFWGDTILTFLGLLVDTINQIISIPCEKIAQVVNMIQFILNKRSKGKALKITVLQLQKICGFLNFLGRAVVPGRAFTWRLYSKLDNPKLKPPPPPESVGRDGI